MTKRMRKLSRHEREANLKWVRKWLDQHFRLQAKAAAKREEEVEG